MCMEDVRIARHSESGQFDFTATNSSQIAISQHAKRYAIVFSAPTVGNITYSLNNPAVLGQGITIGAGGGPIALDLQHHGDLVRRAWYAISDQASVKTSILVSVLEKE